MMREENLQISRAKLLLVVAIQILTFAISVAAQWGMWSQRQAEIERRVYNLEEKSASRESIEDIRERLKRIEQKLDAESSYRKK